MTLEFLLRNKLPLGSSTKVNSLRVNRSLENTVFCLPPNRKKTIGGLSATTRLECFDLFDPAFVASTVEAGIEPNFNQSLDQLLANQIRRETQHIDVVMATTDFSRHFVMAGSRTNSRHFIRGNRHPNASPTDQKYLGRNLGLRPVRNDRDSIRVINRR